MPTSSYKHIPAVMAILRWCPKPTSVLDVGPGFGKYGVIFREHLDIRKRRYAKQDWQTRIDCVEVWEDYITPLHRHVYDRVIVGDIREVAPDLDTYDLVIMSDVLEHMVVEEGAWLLRQLLDNTVKQGVVVRYPRILGGEGRHWANPHETHKSVWTYDLFDKLQLPAANMVHAVGVTYILKEQ